MWDLCQEKRVPQSPFSDWGYKNMTSSCRPDRPKEDPRRFKFVFLGFSTNLPSEKELSRSKVKTCLVDRSNHQYGLFFSRFHLNGLNHEVSCPNSSRYRLSLEKLILNVGGKTHTDWRPNNRTENSGSIHSRISEIDRCAVNCNRVLLYQKAEADNKKQQIRFHLYLTLSEFYCSVNTYSSFTKVAFIFAGTGVQSFLSLFGYRSFTYSK
jgi:hypothetical protein